jgi:hypothetical protein
VKPLNTGSLNQRLRFVILAGELDGPPEMPLPVSATGTVGFLSSPWDPRALLAASALFPTRAEAAREQLHQLEAKLADNLAASTVGLLGSPPAFGPFLTACVLPSVQVTPDQKALLATLRQLYDDYAAGLLQTPSVSQAQRQQLCAHLGWFGRLALAPAEGPDPEARAAVLSAAHRTVISFVSYLTGLGLVGLIGFVGLVLLVIFLFSGKLRRGIHTGLAHGGVYAETFAVWMTLFLLLSLGAAKLPFEPEVRWLVTGLAFLLSLVALWWPVLRGIPWRQVRWKSA